MNPAVPTPRARVRVFLLTYRRPELLRRALRSLLAQSFSDWVCELHNDAPGDDAPRALLAELAPGDARFIYCAHERNWGAVAAFNHVYAGGPEPLASMLEDDNWWEPPFLEAAVRALDRRPDAALAWANMKIWQEQPGGRWADTGKTVWTTSPATPEVVAFHGPEILQAFDALHSNGAMVFRPDKFRTSAVPATTPFAIIESLRERAAAGPLLLVTPPLAHFACTIETARDDNPTRWLQAKLLMGASFFGPRPADDASLRKMWAVARSRRPRDTDIFFCLALAVRQPRLVRSARLGDWVHFLLSAGRHPVRLARGLRFRHDHAEVWNWLRAQPSSDGQTVHATVCTKQL